jgi:glyoxylase-like metal-dependent hydrolase (beta-lactamase superfamily II)
MARVLGAVLGAAVVAVGIGAIWLYNSVTSLESERVSGDVHVIRGAGGNVGVLRTDTGAVVVDSMLFRMQGQRIRELSERIAGGPVQALLNTHYHQDHTHGNPAFPGGTRVVAAARTLDYLLHFDAPYWEGAAAETLPNDLVEASHEMRIGGKTIRSLHPGAGHTGGDLVVLFVEDRVLHAGDLLFAGRYPRIDIAGGGSVRAWIASLDVVLELDFEHVIPGHGPVTDKDGVRRFQAFLAEALAAVEDALRRGRSLEETLAGARLEADAGFEPGGLPPFAVFTRETLLEEVYAELSGSAAPADVPPAAQGER